MISAIFVYKDGIYSNLDDVDVWCQHRDAMKYDGPHPVVAHPPCQLWGSLAYVNYKRWGGEHNKPGNDGGMFVHALNCVNKFGGVLEHPAYSRAFYMHGIKRPEFGKWLRSGCGWVTEVWQSAYGHQANKRTWLYYKGTRPPPPLIWEKVVGTHQIGGARKTGKNKPTISGKKASATPLMFRDALIHMARYSA